MKHYVLKKDLPTFKKGNKFHISSDGGLVLDNSWTVAYDKSTLEEFPNILKDWFEEIPDNKRRRADYGSEYYFVNDLGYVDKGEDYRDVEDDIRYGTGNYGLTEEELEAKLKYDTARQTLLDDAEGGRWVEGDSNWYVFHSGTSFVITSSAYYKPGIIYFRSIDVLKNSLKKHKKQWKIVRKYETGEM